MTSFPFKRFLVNGAFAMVFNVACALIVTSVIGRPERFPWVLYYSMCIGTSIFIAIEGLRLAVWRNKLKWKVFLPLVLLLVPVCQYFGVYVGNLILGEQPNPTILWTKRWFADLLFAYCATGVAFLLFVGRERLVRARAEAANERARAERVERQALQTQLQVLQAQLEPHMLFNTLANVQGLIAIDPGRAQQMLDQLIQYLRATLGSSRAGQTTLAQEFALLDAYLGLMAVRMGERLRYSLHLPTELRATPLPPMLLQPLVENAIAHGLEPKVEGGSVSVSAEQRADAIALIVRDDGRGPDAPPGKAGTSVGLSNTRERLLAVYGARASLFLEAAQPSGATATIMIPTTP